MAQVIADRRDVDFVLHEQFGVESLSEHEIVLEATGEAVAKLAEQGFDPRFGARPVRRVIQQEVQDRLADLILAGEVAAEQTVVLDVDADGFRLQAKKEEARA